MRVDFIPIIIEKHERAYVTAVHVKQARPKLSSKTSLLAFRRCKLPILTCSVEE